MPGAVGRTLAPPARDALEQNAEFAGRLEAWGGLHRVIVASLGVLVLWVGVGTWPVALVGPYLLVAIATLVSARRHPRPISETPLGALLLLMDVLVVGALGYAWGTATSPVLWMNVPIVLGWTLVTRRSFGRVSLFAVLGVTATVLVGEQLGLWPTAPALGGAPALDVQQRLSFFGFFALALSAGHVLVSEVVTRLEDHAEKVSRLEAEHRMRAKEHELAARLDQSQRMQALGRLAGGVAHDFNNVMMGLSGLAELAELRMERDPHAARSALQELLAQTHRASKLTTRLLDYARERPQEPVETDLAALLTDRRPLIEQLVRKRMRLSIRGAPNCWVHIDPAELSRLLMNLAANAFDAASGGGELRIRVQRDGDQVQLTVQDDGAGIAPEDLPRVFDPFFTTKPTGEAAGLGLSAAFGIVRRSGGTIDIRSQPGEGTIVTLRWPAAAAAETSARADSPAPANAKGSSLPAASAHDASAKRAGETEGPLLLVDDDEAVRAVLQAQLEDAGYCVEVAEGARQALQTVRAQPPHHHRMLITDVLMPGMTGPELASEFARHCPGAPVLFISGYAEDALDDAGALRPMLQKPFTSASLLEAVRQALRGEDDSRG